MPSYELSVSEVELNMVLTALGQLPYAQVNELMCKLSEQLQAQLAARTGEPPLQEVKADRG